MLVYQNSFRRKISKNCSFSFANLRLTSLSSRAGWRLLFVLNRQTRFKMVHSSPNNAKSRIHQSQACFLHTTHVGILQLGYV